LCANSSPGSAASPSKAAWARHPRHKPTKTCLLTEFTLFDLIFIMFSDSVAIWDRGSESSKGKQVNTEPNGPEGGPALGGQAWRLDCDLSHCLGFVISPRRPGAKKSRWYRVQPAQANENEAHLTPDPERTDRASGTPNQCRSLCPLAKRGDQENSWKGIATALTSF